MTIEIIDYLPILHAIPVDGVKTGAQFFAKDGSKGVRGVVQHPFGRSPLSNASHGLPMWKSFEVIDVFCFANTRNEGSMRFGFNDKVWAEIPPNLAGVASLVQPVVLQGAPTLTADFKFDNLHPNLGGLEAEVGWMAVGLAALAEKVRTRNATWQQELQRSGRDQKINGVMSLLENLFLCVATVPMVIGGFAGRAEIEFV